MNRRDLISFLEPHFRELTDHALSDLKAGEDAVWNLDAEDTLYARFNANRVRQNTDVEQIVIALKFQSEGRTVDLSRTLSGNRETDQHRVAEMLRTAREEARALPADPNQVPLADNGRSHGVFRGQSLSPSALIEDITQTAAGSDLAGLYCGGAVITANRNSKGQDHWFATESFFMDYSLYEGARAAKGVFAGPAWNRDEWSSNLARTRSQLNLLSRPARDVKPGRYRTYFAPGAISEIVSTMAWGGLSSSAWKQGRCAFKKLADGERTLSPLFTIRENFDLGLSPRFNSLGEVAAPTVTLIEGGRFREFLTSSRSEKEHGLKSNAASEGEYPRSPEIMGGALEERDVLRELGTGLYLSNLHYLNWSDVTSARITGMTRYACFWVENGEIAGPIKDLRFDESLYEAFGSKLTALTRASEIDPNVMTYGAHALGGKKVPGAIIDDFTFTL